MSLSISIGLGLTGGVGAGLSFSSEAEALFARFTTPPTATRKVQIDTLIKSLKTAGVWTKLDALYLLAAADAQAAQRNWIADSFNLTVVGTPTFTADRGYKGSTGNYLKTGFIPSTAAGQFQLNSASLGVSSRTSAASTGIDIGARTTSTTAQTYINVRSSASDVISAKLNQDTGTNPTGTNTDGTGNYLMRRNSSTQYEMFKNGTLFGTNVQVSSAVPSIELYLLSLNTAGATGNPSTREISAAVIGGGLTDTEVANFNSALNTYLQAVGAA